MESAFSYSYFMLIFNFDYFLTCTVVSPQINYPLDYGVNHIHFYRIFLVRQLAHFELNAEDFEPT